MKTTRLLTICSSFLLFTLWGCSGKETKEAGHDDHHHHAGGDSRIVEVMAVHDSIMLRMGELMELSEAIRSRGASSGNISDSTKKATGKGGTVPDTAGQILAELDEAGEAMMSWMHHFKSDTLDKLNDEEARHYLALQKDGILKVKAKMEKSITNAQQYLNK